MASSSPAGVWTKSFVDTVGSTLPSLSRKAVAVPVKGILYQVLSTEYQIVQVMLSI